MTDATGWPATSGPALVAAVTIGIERGLLPPALHDAGARRRLLDLPDDQAFVHEGLASERFRGRVRHRQHVGERPALVAEIEGTAWLTGAHRFWIDDDDPLREGLRL